MSTTGQPPTRICRKCSVASVSTGDFCPNCGSSFTRRSRRPSRKIVFVGLAVLLIVGAATAGVLVKQRNDEVARDRAAATAQREAERATAREAAEEEADETERSARRELVKALEEQVTKDAQEKVADDLLEGPIKYSSCTATGGGSTDDLTALTGTFECLAANKENDDGTISGYRHSGTTEWATGSITWRLGG